jgi:hypothetical protein
MKKTLLSIFVFAVTIISFSEAQTLSPKVMPSSGGYFSAGGKSLSWTMGETFTYTLTAGNVKLTQGFQQPYVELTVLNVKAFIEGYYEAAVANSQPSGQMNDNGGLGGLLYKTGNSPTFNAVDTVTISAMNATAPYALVGSKKGIININGNVSVKFGPEVLPGQSYYIKINHRNTIETWSASPVLFASITSYDFSTAANKAYGNNMILTSDGLNYAFFSGDISDATTATVGIQDAVVESQDYSDMENAVYLTILGYAQEDITGDAVVESADYGLMENNVYFTRVRMRP